MESNLKDRFDEFGSAPSNGLWDRIESTLDEKPQRKPLFWWLFYAVASIFIVGIVTMHFQTPGISNNQQSEAISQLNKQKELERFAKQNAPVNKASDSANGISDTDDSTKEKAPADPSKKGSNEKHLQKQESKFDRNKLFNSQGTFIKGEENSNQIVLESKKTDPNNQNSERKNEQDPKMDDSVKSKEALSQNEKDSGDNNTITESKSKIDTILPLEKDILNETSSNPRFEIGFSYSLLAGQRKEKTATTPTNDNSFNSVPSTQLSSETYSVSDSNTKYYDIAMPLNFHLNYTYYFNSKWRLDNELGYSQFKYTYLDADKNKLAHHTIIRSISIPISISYVTTLRKPQHTLNYGAGLINDLSFATWNSSYQFYYGLSAQIKLGYGFRFGASESWKASINFVMRQALHEGLSQKSGFNNRLLYGGQIGIAKCFN